LRWISIKAVLLGVVATLGIDAVVGSLALLLWPGSSLESLKDGSSTLQLQTDFLLFSLVAGTLSTAVGGAVCALKAPALPYWNVAAYGVIGVLLGVLLTDPAQPAWFTVFGFLSTPPAGFVGARMALRRA
jgi:hypothetical protein